MKERLEQALFRTAIVVGDAQAALAADYRQAGAFRRACLLPTWAVARAVFLALYALYVELV